MCVCMYVFVCACMGVCICVHAKCSVGVITVIVDALLQPRVLNIKIATGILVSTDPFLSILFFIPNDKGGFYASHFYVAMVDIDIPIVI